MSNATMVEGPEAAGLAVRLATTSSPKSRQEGGQRQRPARTIAGCPHEPHTCYIAERNAVFCGSCGESIVGEANAAKLLVRVSSLLEEAEALQQELSLRRQQASKAMADAPAFSELEAARQRAKTQVDDILLAMVKHVDATRKRLHADIDAAVADRAQNVTSLVRATNQADALLQDCERQLARSVHFSPAHAVAVQQDLAANIALLDNLATLSAHVRAPFELELRKQYANFDLSGMRVVVPQRGSSASHSPSRAAAAAEGTSPSTRGSEGGRHDGEPPHSPPRPRGSSPRWEPGSPSPVRFTSADDAVAESPHSKRIFEQTGRSLLRRLYE